MRIKENKALLHQANTESDSMQELRNELKCDEKQLTELQNTVEQTIPRRSERPRVPTEKMLAHQNEEQTKREKKLLSIYEHWKGQVRIYRENLKVDLSDAKLAEIADGIERTLDDMTKTYRELRERHTPSTAIRRKMDSCEAVTKDIMKVITERLAAIDDFDAEKERQRLHQLLTHEHARSIYGTASQSSCHSETSSIAAKRIDAAAELAVKEAQYKITQEEIKQRKKIRDMEEKYKRELDAQNSELERLQAEKEIQAARAKLDVYNKEMKGDMDSQLMVQYNVALSVDNNPAHPVSVPSVGSYHPLVQFNNTPVPAPKPVHQSNPYTVTSVPPTDISQLAKAIQDSIAINRIPVPMPIVFSGDPITYIEWKASFFSLVDSKGIAPADKLHLLKRYITGPALKCLEGTFYRSDEAAYNDAWKRLDQRYGQPFVVQRAFRDKLSKWPKIHPKDAEGLRTFSDFLTACLQAMPHVKGLEILSDCEENQKLLQKVPEWLATRWNRQVTVALIDGKDFPSFKDFAHFVALEAEIACNPVTSSYALHSCSSFLEKGNSREIKSNRSTTQVFTTQAAIHTDKANSNNTKLKGPCIFCKYERHQLSKCPRFSEKLLVDKRTFVKDNKLCYGCLKVGHNAKDCRHRHTCDVCKGRHPTCLHDENHKSNERNPSPATTSQTTTNSATSATTLNVTEVGQSSSTSMIVPVWVSTVHDPSKEQLVYALLDTQSDNTFISEEISNHLQADAHPVKLKLTTMLGVHTMVKSQRVSGLRVRGYYSYIHIDLPPSYTKDYIPFNYDNIPTNETAKRWPHMTEIVDKMPPLLSCDVGLLIGFNCPRTLAPKQVLHGRDNEPFAIQTDLGWSIVGSSTSGLMETETSLCHRVTVKELPPMDAKTVLESDFKDTKVSDKTVSQEDLIFLDKLKEGIRKNEQGHCEMLMPFKQRPPLPDLLKPRWESWQNDFTNLEKLNITRCYLPGSFGEVKEMELHISDASVSGYRQCTYMRARNVQGDCTLVIAKARVSPTKLTTIPRLELTAAVVSVTVSNMLREELSYASVKEYFWTYSRVVLGYINNDARRFHTFVANRVQKIRQSTSPQQWFYVPSKVNPADRASRGLNVTELITSNWFAGPTFLWEKELPTPESVELDLSIGDPEVRKAQTMLTQVTDTASLSERLCKFSSWSKAVKAVAHLIRRAKQIKSSVPASVSELESAERVIIGDVQSRAYEKEIKLLSKGNQLPRHSKLYHLDVFIDTDGLLKVGGRLKHSPMNDSFKHPIVIPKEHYVTKLIISHCHDKIKHQGKGFTTNEIRSSGYWIPGMSRTVASFIRQCVICRKLRKAPEGQRMSDLPVERLEPSSPFTYCGMDCFGPFVTTEGRKEHKRYGLLFTCFCSRAIHIELLEDLSTDTFINALRCFIAIRGNVRQIQCDQGTNFVGAQNEFKAALNELDTQRLSIYLSQKQCDFVMNAPHSSHTGGVWERQIKTVRSILNTTLSLAHGRLNDASLRTLFYEAMAIVNSRPLTVDNLNNPDSLEPLTPNHLLHMKTNTALPPPGSFTREDLYGKKRWRRVQFLAEQFWCRWRREYVHNIIARQKWHSPKRNLKVGDVVLDMDELLPRGEWRLGRVIAIVDGKDGLVRRVKITLGDKKLNSKGQRSNKPSVLERPVHKLVLVLESS